MTLALVGLAAMVRLAAIFVLRSYRTTETAYEHHTIAMNLIMGHGFSFPFLGPLAPTSQQAPLVPFLLAACYAVFGVGSPRALLLFQVIATAAALATVYALSELARRVGGDRACLLAGLGFSVYPALVISVTHVQAVPFVIAWLALMVLWAFRAAEDFNLGNLIVMGVWVALGALTDPTLLFPATALLGYLVIIWRVRAGWIGAARYFGLTAGIIVLALTPWTVRNWKVHHRLVPIKDSFWYVLWQGNGPAASGTDKLIPPGAADDPEPSLLDLRGRFQKLLRERRESVSVNSLLPAEFLTQLAQMPTEIQRMDAFGGRIRDFLRENPRHYLRMCLRRFGYFLTFDPTNPKTSDPLYRVSYMVLAALACVGAVVGRSQWRHLTAIYGAVVGIALPSVLIITSARFRLPVEALLIILAALGLARLLPERPLLPDSRPCR